MAIFNSYVKLPEGTLWLFNIVMENGPFMDDFPTKTSIYRMGIFHGYVK